MVNLSNVLVDLLLKCLENHRPDLIWVVSDKTMVTIDRELGNELRDAVSDELVQSGLEGDAPTEYGLRLEKLIDDIGRMFI